MPFRFRLGLATLPVSLAIVIWLFNPPQSRTGTFGLVILSGLAAALLAWTLMGKNSRPNPRLSKALGAGSVAVALALAWAALPTAGVGARNSQPTPTSGARFPETPWGPTDRAVSTIGKGGLPYPDYNCIIDARKYGDERNFTLVAENRSGPYSDDLIVHAGRSYWVQVYFNNCGPDNDSGTSSGRIHGARLTVVPQVTPSSLKIWTFLSGENVRNVWDSATLHSKSPVKFELNAPILRNEIYDRGKELVPSPWDADGTLLGYRKMDGKLDPGYRYSGCILFRIRVSGQ